MTTNILLGLVLALFAADAWTTMRVMNQGGVEKNKPLAWLMGVLGRNEALTVMKVGAFVGCLLYPETWFLSVVASVYAVVVVHNYRQIRGAA